MCDRNENVKLRKTKRSNCCFCHLAKRRKPSDTTDELETERIELPMVTPPIVSFLKCSFIYDLIS